jgi:hypothetical protein
MSIKLQVPAIYAPILGDLLKLSPEAMRELLNGIQELQPTMALEGLAEALANRLPLDARKTRAIVELLSSLNVAREGLGMDRDEFIAELRSAMEQSGKEDLHASDWSAFEELLTAALSTDSSLSLSSKAVDVLTDHARVFWYARTLTDLRSVFRSEVEQKPAAMVIVHTLKIAYREAGTNREFFVALDSADVRELIESLERALKKEESLKSLASEKGIAILEVKP